MLITRTYFELRIMKFRAERGNPDYGIAYIFECPLRCCAIDRWPSEGLFQSRGGAPRRNKPYTAPFSDVVCRPGTFAKTRPDEW